MMRYILIILLFSMKANGQNYLLGIVTGSSPTPPVSTVYKIVCAGNSLTYGANFPGGSDSSYPAQLSVMLPASRIVNLGENGQTTEGMLGQYSSRAEPEYTADTLSILIAWEIGNSLWVGFSTDSTKAQISRYCQQGKTTGFSVIVATAPSRGFVGNNPAGHDSAYYNRQLDTVNNWVRANYTMWADGIVNMDQDADINNFLNTTYRDPDMIHYNGVGYNRIATLFKNSIIAL